MLQVPPRWRAALFVISVVCLLPVTLVPVNWFVARGMITTGSAGWHAGMLWGAFAATLLPTVIAALIEKRPLGTYGLPWSRRGGARFREGIAWGLAAATLFVLILYLSNRISWESSHISLRDGLRPGAAWALAMLGLAFFEELVMRGYLQSTLASSMGFWPAALLISCAFAVEKLLSTEYRSPVAVSAAVAYGLLWCFALRQSGSLWFGAGFNAAVGWALVFLYGVGIPISGHHAQGALTNAAIQGPDWLTGGSSLTHIGALSSFLLLLVWMGLGRRFAKSAQDLSIPDK